MIGKLQQGIEGRRKHQEQLCRRLHLLQFDQIYVDCLIILETINLGKVRAAVKFSNLRGLIVIDCLFLLLSSFL